MKPFWDPPSHQEWRDDGERVGGLVMLRRGTEYVLRNLK